MQPHDLDAVLAKIPLLTVEGIALPYAYGLSPGEIMERQAAEREALLAHIETLGRVCAWLSSDSAAKCTHINRTSTSFGLMNIATRLLGVPVPVGVVIAAAVHLGFDWRQVDHNAHFNLSADFIERAAEELNRHSAVNQVWYQHAA